MTSSLLPIKVGQVKRAMHLAQQETSENIAVREESGVGSANERSSLFQWPDVPVFSDTLVQLDLLLNSPVVDLDKVMNLALSDLGATVQILRHFANADGSSRFGTLRIEEYLVSLSRPELLEVMPTVAHGSMLQGISPYCELSYHSWLVSQFSFRIAHYIPHADPYKVRVAGLLHDIGKVPVALCWGTEFTHTPGSEILGRRLVKDWMLPWYMTYGVCYHQRKDPSAAVISRIIAAAHDCEQMWSGAVYLDAPERYKPYWKAILERHLPELTEFGREQVLRDLLIFARQIPY